VTGENICKDHSTFCLRGCRIDCRDRDTIRFKCRALIYLFQPESGQSSEKDIYRAKSLPLTKEAGKQPQSLNRSAKGRRRERGTSSHLRARLSRAIESISSSQMTWLPVETHHVPQSQPGSLLVGAGFISMSETRRYHQDLPQRPHTERISSQRLDGGQSRCLWAGVPSRRH
jgi:hypothetical protein